MATPHLIPVPKETVSDDAYQVARLYFKDGQKVEADAVIATLETSKAAIDVTTPVAGYVYYAATEGGSIAVGANLAAIAATAARPSELAAARPTSAAAPAEDDDVMFSEPARRLVEQHRLDRSLFAGLALVRVEDVERVLARAAKPTLPDNLPKIHAQHVLIWGGGGHAKVCIEILRAAGQFEPYGIVDGKLPVGSDVLGVPVLGHEATLEEFFRRGVRHATVGVGAVTYHQRRGTFFERLRAAGFQLPNLIHPRAAIDPSTRLGDGNQVFAHATISAAVRIGNGCIVNSGAVISHDCELADNVHLAPGALLAGGIKVGENTLVGMGAKIFLGVKIGRGVRINNGVVVDRDVEDHAVVQR